MRYRPDPSGAELEADLARCCPTRAGSRSGVMCPASNRSCRIRNQDSVISSQVPGCGGSMRRGNPARSKRCLAPCDTSLKSEASAGGRGNDAQRHWMSNWRAARRNLAGLPGSRLEPTHGQKFPQRSPEKRSRCAQTGTTGGPTDEGGGGPKKRSSAEEEASCR